MTVGTANGATNGVAGTGISNGHHKSGGPNAGSLQARQFQGKIRLCCL